MKQSTRRNFLAQSALAGAGTLLALPTLGALAKTAGAGSNAFLSPIVTSFNQLPLPYAYNALEPSIDALTMEIHYTKHAAGYCKNLKEAALAEGVDTSKPLEDVLYKISKYSVKMRNNAGGHYNHSMFWQTLTPDINTQPSGELVAAINTTFGSVDEMKKQFNAAASTRFGSGWAWLIVKKDKKLAIISTANQDNSLMDIAEVKGFPLFGLDVWEHAYYLKYQNRRADYIASFWKIVNWNYINLRFESIEK